MTFISGYTRALVCQYTYLCLKRSPFLIQTDFIKGSIPSRGLFKLNEVYFVTKAALVAKEKGEKGLS